MNTQNNNLLRILAVGDVVGNMGMLCIEKLLRKVRALEHADFVIVNGENSASSNGIDVKCAEKIFSCGADVITGGNHTLKRRDFYNYLNDNDTVLRPLNYQPGCPGNGYYVARVKSGLQLLVINVAGQVFMDPADSPFYTVERVLNEVKHDLCIADFHGEATGEKLAFASYFDGKIQCVFGTHTHVQTADERLTDKGGAYITDLGLCGAENSILGIKPECVLPRYLSREYSPFETPDSSGVLCGALFTINIATGFAVDVKRLKYTLTEE